VLAYAASSEIHLRHPLAEIAMGLGGTDVVVETADIALAGDDLLRLIDILELGEHTVTVIQQNYAMSIVVNALGLIAGAAGGLSPVLAAVLHNASSVAVVANSQHRCRSGYLDMTDRAGPICRPSIRRVPKSSSDTSTPADSSQRVRWRPGPVAPTDPDDSVGVHAIAGGGIHRLYRREVQAWGTSHGTAGSLARTRSRFSPTVPKARERYAGRAVPPLPAGRGGTEGLFGATCPSPYRPWRGARWRRCGRPLS
jgi:hypothetical protein